MAEIKSDFRTMDEDGMIDPQDFIKHARYVNAFLGLKLNQTKQKTIQIRNGKGKLPSDFDTFNFAFMMNSFTEVLPRPSLVQTLVVPIPNFNPNAEHVNVCLPSAPEEVNLETCSPCSNHDTCHDCNVPYTQCMCVPSDRVRIDCKGNATVIVQEYKSHIKVHRELIPLTLVNSPEFEDSEFCFTKEFKSLHNVSIRGNFIFTGITNGTMYLNYEGMMETDEGDLLVLDHPLINSFYEYYLKSKCIELAEEKGYQVSQNLQQRVETNLRNEKILAASIVNQIEFTDIKKAYKVTRRAFFAKYIKMFSSY